MHVCMYMYEYTHVNGGPRVMPFVFISSFFLYVLWGNLLVNTDLAISASLASQCALAVPVSPFSVLGLQAGGHTSPGFHVCSEALNPVLYCLRSKHFTH